MPTISFIGACFQFVTIIACVTSIWLPGSPFTLANKLFKTGINHCIENNSPVTGPVPVMKTANNISATEPYDASLLLIDSLCLDYTSIVTLLTGIALSRFGLWLTDLAIHQIIQETVPEKKRGAIAGAQSSLNYFFDTIKYAAVIYLSDVSHYGYLVMISTVAVIAAFCLNTVYTIIMWVSGKPELEEEEDEEEGGGKEPKEIEMQDIEVSKGLN